MNYLKQIDHADEIVLVVQERKLHAFPDSFHRREMDYRHDFVAVEDMRQICDIQQIALVEGHMFPSNLFNALQSHRLVLVVGY